MAPDSSPRRRRRYDPERRDRIIDACLEVIATHGLAGTTHRKIAAVADVPLGSMTYHFDGIGNLLEEAFERFAASSSTRFEDRLGTSKTPEEVAEAITDFIIHDLLVDPRELALTMEFYTLAARDPRYRRITHAWMRNSRLQLEKFFSPLTSRILDAFIEGITIHRALDLDFPEEEAVRVGISRILTYSSP